MSSIEAVIFDLEGVIIDSELYVWDKVGEIFLKRRGLTYNKDATKPLMMGRTLEEGIGIWQQHYGFGGDIEELTQERREIAAKIFKEEIPFIPGFTDFYQTIKDKYKTAVATSLERQFLEALERKMDLSNMFNGHVYSIEDIGMISKPSPDIYLYAANKLGVLPIVCVGIEDAPNGIEALKKAGMRSIAITTSTTREKLTGADLVVDSFSQIYLTKL